MAIYAIGALFAPIQVKQKQKLWLFYDMNLNT
jgi:hypothetical protein